MPSNNNIYRRYAYWLFAALNLLVFVKAYHFYGSGIRGTDGQMYYAYVRSLVIDGDLDFKNEFSSETPFPAEVLEKEQRQTATGLVANKYPIGYSLLVLPFFLLAHLLTILGNALSLFQLSPDGYSRLYDFLVPLGNLCYALWGFSLAWSFLRKYFAPGLSFLALSAVWFGTSLFYYADIFSTMTHALGFFLVSALFVQTERSVTGEGRRVDWFLLGLVAGLLIVLRPTNFLFLLFPVMIILLERPSAIRLSNFVSAVVPFLVIVSLQMIVWHVLYGSPLIYSYSGESFNWGTPELYRVLFSSNHGLFFFAPITALATFGVVAGLFFSRDQNLRRRLWIFSLIGSATYYLNASWHSWWFGHAFGARAFTELGIVFALGLSLLASYSPKVCRATATLCVICLAWTNYLLYLYAYSKIPLEGELFLHQLLP